jgi:hypothetical protein
MSTILRLNSSELPSAGHPAHALIEAAVHITVEHTADKVPAYVLTLADNSVAASWPAIKAVAQKLMNDCGSSCIVYNRWTLAVNSAAELSSVGPWTHEADTVDEDGITVLGRPVPEAERGTVNYYELLRPIIFYLHDCYDAVAESLFPNIVVNILYSGAGADVGPTLFEQLSEFHEGLRGPQGAQGRMCMRPVTINCVSFADAAKSAAELNVFYYNLWRSSPKQGLFMSGMYADAANVLVSGVCRQVVEPMLFLINEVAVGAPDERKTTWANVRAIRRQLGDKGADKGGDKGGDKADKGGQLGDKRTPSDAQSGGTEFYILMTRPEASRLMNGVGHSRFITNWPDARLVIDNEARAEPLSTVDLENVFLFSIFNFINPMMDKLHAKKYIDLIESGPHTSDMCRHIVATLKKVINRSLKNDDLCAIAHKFSLLFA